MRLAFISYEYPPETGGGGIATYVDQAAAMLAARGHDVWVFCGRPTGETSQSSDGDVTVVRVPTNSVESFAKDVEAEFARAHCQSPFDVIEGPDYQADAHCIAESHPGIPLVLRLHSSRRICRDLNLRLPIHRRIWGWTKAIVMRRQPWWRETAEDIVERDHAVRDADLIAAPSKAIVNLAVKHWSLRAPIEIVPYPYAPSESRLRLDPTLKTNRITFIGRLEPRKGVLELASAIPLVSRKHPDWRFRFIGAETGVSRERIRSLAGKWGNSIEFVNPVPNTDLPAWFGETDICVFPSRWENVGLVCLEAMSAGRGVVASRSGGMAEMIEDGVNGLLINPKKPSDIARAICRMIESPDERVVMAKRARTHVLKSYSSEVVGPLQEALYAKAIRLNRRIDVDAETYR